MKIWILLITLNFLCFIWNVFFNIGKHKLVFVLLSVLGLSISISGAYNHWLYEWHENPNGTITSRKYGTYPKKVPFKQGMTIMPGQIAKMAVVIPIKPEETKNEKVNYDRSNGSIS